MQAHLICSARFGLSSFDIILALLLLPVLLTLVLLVQPAKQQITIVMCTIKGRVGLMVPCVAKGQEASILMALHLRNYPVAAQHQ